MENNKNGWTDSGNRTHVCVKSTGPELNLPEGWLWFPWLSWDLLICALCIFSFRRSDLSGGFANKAVWIWKEGSWPVVDLQFSLLAACHVCISRFVPVWWWWPWKFCFYSGLGSCFSTAFLPDGQFGKFTNHCVLLLCSSSVRLFIWKCETMTGLFF